MKDSLPNNSRNFESLKTNHDSSKPFVEIVCS